MKAVELIEALAKKLGTNSQAELAAVLGVTVATLINWKKRGENLSALQVASALAKSRSAAVQKSQLETIQPIVEFYPINKYQEKKEASWQLFDAGKNALLYAKGLKAALDDAYGIYVFYDSRGQALYVGKACLQTLWKEMNFAFNRDRGKVQSIKLAHHPEQNREFKPGYEKLRQPRDTQLKLSSLARYFSAYRVDDGMIEDLEALLVRAFANSLLNIKMETFAHSRA